MEKEFVVPFWNEINKHSGCANIQQKIYRHSKSQILSSIFFYCCLPWNALFGIYEKVMGVYNVHNLKVNTNAKYTLAVVAIAKNESEYIAEWLAFHIASGVEHIYLYDNDSTDSMPEIVEKFVKKGYVTLNKIHGEKQQYNAYTDAIKKYGKECKYMAFIDCDEYLQTVDPHKTLIGEIERLIARDNAKAGVAVNWVMYGSSNFEEKPDGFCFESFIMRATPGKKGTNCIKSIVRPECVISFSHAHVPNFKMGFYNVNTSGNMLNTWSNPVSEYCSMRLNHYFTKSKAQWIKRRSVKRADDGTIRTLDEFYEHDNNDVVDKSALVYLDKVKVILNDVLG